MGVFRSPDDDAAAAAKDASEGGEGAEAASAGVDDVDARGGSEDFRPTRIPDQGLGRTTLLRSLAEEEENTAPHSRAGRREREVKRDIPSFAMSLLGRVRQPLSRARLGPGGHARRSSRRPPDTREAVCTR